MASYDNSYNNEKYDFDKYVGFLWKNTIGTNWPYLEVFRSSHFYNKFQVAKI
jgi:hypothetical protein